MKLDGPPGIGIRLEFHYERSRIVVTGVFPPECATSARSGWQLVADNAQPRLREFYFGELDKMSNTFLYGDLYDAPTDPNPIGLLGDPHLRGEPYTASLTRGLGALAKYTESP